MELRKHPLTSIFQPFIQSLQFSNDEFYSFDETETRIAYFMPLVDLVETIHQAYYFKKAICLEFEQKDEDGFVYKVVANGTIQTPILENNRVAFTDQSNITHLLSLEQLLTAKI